MLTGSPADSFGNVIDPTEFSGWEEIIATFPEHSFFHSSNWARVLKEAYSYQPLYFTRWQGSALSAFIPVMEIDSFLTGKRGVSIPFTDYCEPLVSNAADFSGLLDEILLYGKREGWKHLELRGGTGYFEQRGFDDRYPGGVTARSKYLRHILQIGKQEDELLRGFNPGTRRNIRKATDSGVRVVISDSKADLDVYYGLHCLTRKLHGLPPQPRRFFDAIYRNVILDGKGFTVLARHQGRNIAGAVYFHSGKKGIYKYGASDRRYQGLRANNLVMWEAIRWLSRNGFEELCFGRTDLDDDGLIRFKRGWGTREQELSYYRYDLRRSIFIQLSPKKNSGRRRVSGLPIPLLRFLGELLYKHVG
jgi:hypothetical protein